MSIKKLIPQSIKNIYHLFQAVIANTIYLFPSKEITIIGVTGTNGKTTTCQMITKILEESGARVAMASTINFKLAEEKWVNETKFTTLSSFSIQKFIKKAVLANCKYLVLETSSHSLDQYRTWGIKYDTAVITNVTREHLDYHKTMDGYREAKLKLFKRVKNAIVNLDMENPEDFLKCGAQNIFGYTAKQETRDEIKIIKAQNIDLRIDSTDFTLDNEKYTLKMPGLFNLENFLAAISACKAHGILVENFKKASKRLNGVPGRIESIPNNKDLKIIIDYAVTPDSLEKVYGLIAEIKKNKCYPEYFARPENSLGKTPKQNCCKIISILGACGQRDRGKRPLMGKIVSRFANIVILTNEDPYHEDPQRIVDEIQAGIKNKEEGKNLFRIMDRRLAIKKALELSSPYDIIVITGKGAEETMAIGKTRIPWNEKKVIQEELKKL